MIAAILRRIFGRGDAWPPPGPITTWPVEAFSGTFRVFHFNAPDRDVVDVVGEDSYQDVLESLSGGRTPDGPMLRDHIAVLLPEPGNEVDPRAVRVALAPRDENSPWGYVGYLSREQAVAYRPVIDRLALHGLVAACNAKLTGGWDRGIDDRGHFGVRLQLGTPAELTAGLDSDQMLLDAQLGDVSQ